MDDLYWSRVVVDQNGFFITDANIKGEWGGGSSRYAG